MGEESRIFDSGTPWLAGSAPEQYRPHIAPEWAQSDFRYGYYFALGVIPRAKEVRCSPFCSALEMLFKTPIEELIKLYEFKQRTHSL